MESEWDDTRPLGTLRSEDDLNCLRFWCPKLMRKLEREQAIWDRVRRRFTGPWPELKEMFKELFRRELAVADLRDAKLASPRVQ